MESNTSLEAFYYFKKVLNNMAYKEGVHLFLLAIEVSAN